MSDIDTIVAIATAPGRGAVGIVRVSGPAAADIAVALTGSLPPPRRARLARFKDAADEPIDEGLALYFPAPHTYTGEAVLELQGHGGPVVLDLLMRRIVELGARPARAGEFSERAFLNGRIDVAQAEGIADLIDAASSAAARAAARSMRGELSARVHGLQAELTALRVRVEAAIDFPEEDVPLLDDATIVAGLERLREAYATLRVETERGVRLTEGFTVVLAGKPNAGKSSLMNRLAGDEVAIVTPEPGTTRDLLRHQVLEGGIPLHLIDTAGLRAAQDPAEAEGVRRARQAMAQADLLLYVIDAASAEPMDARTIAEQAEDVAPGVPVTVVLNKIDLPGAQANAAGAAAVNRVALSARTGEGLAALRAHLRHRAGEHPTDASALTARRRHLVALERAHAHFEQAESLLRAAGEAELIAEELRLAQSALGEITGEFGSDDLLGEIFRSFCIGK
ncbi:MAG: tRNA uridine-5-carboxymethylaminomethyl(34) synthesis GTPase MnmE [Gammaproteobacteria bacterium]|nr:tRNA uridine-5-carboxymethylaminomethyl(34) synthesis GTPase MnmE [Gammaproteobacteria bacterium]